MTQDNPYSPPQSEVRDVSPASDVPAGVLRKIKTAWIAGLVSGGVTLIFAALGIQGFNLLYLIDVVLILGLSYGIYRKSRVAAIAMLVYFIISKAIIIARVGLPGAGVITGLLFLYFYWQGVVGTTAYRKIIQGQYASQRRSEPGDA